MSFVSTLGAFTTFKFSGDGGNRSFWYEVYVPNASQTTTRTSLSDITYHSGNINLIGTANQLGANSRTFISTQSNININVPSINFTKNLGNGIIRNRGANIYVNSSNNTIFCLTSEAERKGGLIISDAAGNILLNQILNGVNTVGNTSLISLDFYSNGNFVTIGSYFIDATREVGSIDKFSNGVVSQSCIIRRAGNLSTNFSLTGHVYIDKTNNDIICFGVNNSQFLKINSNLSNIITQQFYRESTTNISIRSSVMDNNNNIYFVATYPNINPGFIGKLDNNGNILWSKKYTGTTAYNTITCDNNGNVIVAGSNYNNPMQMSIICFSEDGNTKYGRTLDFTGSNTFSNNMGVTINLTNDIKSVYIVNGTRGVITGILKYPITGNLPSNNYTLVSNVTYGNLSLQISNFNPSFSNANIIKDNANVLVNLFAGGNYFVNSNITTTSNTFFGNIIQTQFV